MRVEPALPASRDVLFGSNALYVFYRLYERLYERLERSTTLCHEDVYTEQRMTAHAVERAVILSDGERVSLHLGPSAGPAVKEAAPPADALYADLPSLRELERRYILHVLRQTGGRVSGEGGADRILGMKRSTLYVRLREYGIRGGDVSGEN